MQQRSVRDLMRIRHGLVVPETSTLREVAERLIISDCDLMAVVDERGRLTGVVCESSIVRALLANPSQDVTIQSIIVRHAESVRLDANIANVQPLFRSCAFQTGEVRGRDLTAFAAHIGMGYTFNTAWSPRLGVEYNYGSGDDDPLDGDVETFQNLFPTNHKFYGQMDVFSWQNMHNVGIILKAAPTKKLTAKAEIQAFWLASTDDSWYRANGVATVRPLNAAARSASNYAGTEADITLTYAATKWLTLEAGYSHFWAGDYLANTGASDDADFGYVQATISF